LNNICHKGFLWYLGRENLSFIDNFTKTELTKQWVALQLKDKEGQFKKKMARQTSLERERIAMKISLKATRYRSKRI